MSLESLSRLSTSLIVASGVCLLLGWYLIRFRRDEMWHRNAMLAATGFAGMFLVVYVTRAAIYGAKPFEGQGIWRTLYVANLVPHVILAMLVGPLALRMIYLAASKRDFVAHRRLGRITVPIWLYTAASGWLVYYMLYGMKF